MINIWRKSKNSVIKCTRRIAMWAVWNVPLGALAPKFLAFALDSESHKIESEK